MRLSAIIFMMLLPLSAFSNSNVVITPDHPGKPCADVGSSSFKNRIYNLQTRENEKEISISFSTEYYQTCDNNKPNLLEITDGFYFDFWREGRVLPWPRPFETESYHLEKSRTLHVDLVFNKIKKFKKTDKYTVQFQFAPNNYRHRGLAFDWRLRLEKIDRLHTRLVFQ